MEEMPLEGILHGCGLIVIPGKGGQHHGRVDAPCGKVQLIADAKVG